LKQASQDPMTLVNRIANIASMKLGEYLVSDDKQELRNLMSMGLKIADVMQKLGAGSKNAADELEKIINQPEEPDEVIQHKSYEDLEAEFLASQPPEIEQ
jgi:hypothetical protein